MITLAGEVVYYKRKRMQKLNLPIKEIQTVKTISVKPTIPDSITFGSTFKPATLDNENIRVSHLTLYPRPRSRINNH